MSFLIALFLGWALERAQMIISAPNYDSAWNGFGVVDAVNKKETIMPMCYRVLVPWVIWLVEKVFSGTQSKRIITYQILKIILNSLAIWAVSLAFGPASALITCVLLLLTFRFDYWDWAPELAGVAFAMTGNLFLAAPGAVAAALSRETAWLIPAAYFLKTGDIPGTAVLVLCVGVPFVAVRLFVGKRPLYCKRFMVVENICALRDLFKWTPFFYGDTFISVVLTILIIPALLSIQPAWIIPAVIFASGWTMGKSDEPRIFSAAIPWVAAWISGMLR